MILTFIISNFRRFPLQFGSTNIVSFSLIAVFSAVNAEQLAAEELPICFLRSAVRWPAQVLALLSAPSLSVSLLCHCRRQLQSPTRTAAPRLPFTAVLLRGGTQSSFTKTTNIVQCFNIITHITFMAATLSFIVGLY